MSQLSDLPVLIYPTGAGGRWLSYTLWARAQGETYRPATVNFHDRPESAELLVSHTQMSRWKTYYFSGTCSFNFYLNFWHKMRCNDNYLEFSQADQVSQLYELSNDAKWRLGAEYQGFYQDQIDLDYRNLLVDQPKFVTQLKQIIDQLRLPITIDDSEFQTAMSNFVTTLVPPSQHMGNLDSLPWRAWCLAMLEHHGRELPTVYSDWSGITEFLTAQQDWILQQSAPHTQYH